MREGVSKEKERWVDCRETESGWREREEMKDLEKDDE